MLIGTMHKSTYKLNFMVVRLKVRKEESEKTQKEPTDETQVNFPWDLKANTYDGGERIADREEESRRPTPAMVS